MMWVNALTMAFGILALLHLFLWRCSAKTRDYRLFMTFTILTWIGFAVLLYGTLVLKWR